jgi:hypothetical protein
VVRTNANRTGRAHGAARSVAVIDRRRAAFACRVMVPLPAVEENRSSQRADAV